MGRAGTVRPILDWETNMPQTGRAAALLILLLASRPALARETSLQDALVLKAEAFIDALARGDFAAAAGDFDETMNKVSGPAKLAVFWKELPARWSPFRRRTASRRDRLGTYDVVLVTCEFEKTTLDARIVFDKPGRIAGFQFVPRRPPAVDRPPAYASSERFQEIELTVGGPEWPLPATLSLPRGEGPFPAVVLVHGSGPNDRDETIGPRKPFRDLAWGLASRGLAVLRYEKRTRVFGPKLIADPRAAFFTVRQETVEDAAAAVRLLRERAGIDPRRIFVLGHSLGGTLLPRIAAALHDPEPAGFISLAGATRPLPQAMIRQVQYLFGLDGQISPEERKSLDDLKAQASAVAALREEDRGTPARYFNAPAAYWLDLKSYDPAAAARRVPQPFLILQGGRDYQVTIDDFENWKKALAGRPDVVCKLFPACDHLFVEGEGPSTPEEYLSVPGNVALPVIEAIVAFVLMTAPGGGGKR
jgi:uncharacterized protein